MSDKSSTTSSSTISTSWMKQVIDRLKMGKHRDSTKKHYYSVWRQFNQFYIRLDEKPNSWEDRLTLFVGHLVNENKKSTTVRSYISAIKAILMDDGVTICEDKFLLSSLTKACRLQNDKVRIRLPIQKRFLNLLITSAYKYFQDNNQNYLCWLYIGIFCAMYYGLLRISEVAEGPHAIRATDVHIAQNKKKILFVLRSSKTHGKDVKPQFVKISGDGDLNTVITKHQMSQHALSKC